MLTRKQSASRSDVSRTVSGERILLLCCSWWPFGTKAENSFHIPQATTSDIEPQSSPVSDTLNPETLNPETLTLNPKP